MHVGSVAVSAGMEVNKGQLIGHTGRDGRSGFPHLHFEIRAGRSYQAYCCNPWKYLPNTANTYSSFTADVTLTPKYNSAANQFEAEVNVSVPPDQLTLNRIEVHVMTHSGSTYVRKFDFCEDNFSHTLQEMDDPMFEGNLLISPNRFNSRSFEKGEKASISFLFKALPSEGGTVYAKAYDVFGNVITSQNTY